MIYVAGFWELGWNTPIKEIDLWEHPLKDFGVVNLLMTPISGIENNYIVEKQTFEEILDFVTSNNLTVVYVDEHASTTLREFQHPEDVIYIFGKASLSPFLAYGQENLAVKIETANNTGGFWPHQAASIVLYDRMIKSWQ